MPEEKNNANPAADATETDSLEAPTTTVESGSPSAGTPAAGTTPSNSAAASGAAGKKPPAKKKPNAIRGLAGRINIYLLLFVFVLLLAGIVTGVSFFKNQQATQADEKQIKTEPLSQEALDQLRQTDVKVGDPKQILSVEANAIFAGKVLIRDSLEVAGEIKAGGPLSLPGITISGNSILSQVQASSLQVTGNTTLQGPLTVQNSINVNGNGSFGGTLTAAKLNIQDFQVTGDLQFARHLDAGGGTPSKSDGGLGSGGTSSVSGTDTAGTVAINTGGAPPAGCMVNLTFAQRYNNTPHVVITPVGSAGASLNYYVNRSSTGFSICTANNPPGGQSFAFDYIVID